MSIAGVEKKRNNFQPAESGDSYHKKTNGVVIMPKGAPNKRYTPELRNWL